MSAAEAAPGLRVIAAYPADKAAAARALLLDVAGPALDGLKEAGALRRWTSFATGVPGLPRPALLVLEGRPSRPEDGERIARWLRELLAPALEREGGAFVADYDDAAVRHFRRARFGGERGIRVQELFRRGLSRLFLETARFCRARPGESTRVALASILLYMETFGLPAEALPAELDRWIAFLAPLAGAGAASVPPPAPADPLAPGAWRRVAPAALVPVWERRARDLARVGRLLAANGPHFEPERPWAFTVFHSYAHVHCALGGVGAADELAAARALRRALAPGRR